MLCSRRAKRKQSRHLRASGGGGTSRGRRVPDGRRRKRPERLCPGSDVGGETHLQLALLEIGKRALDNRIQREAEGIRSTWGKERKNARLPAAFLGLAQEMSPA